MKYEIVFSAYEVLSDPQKRKEYDMRGSGGHYTFTHGTRANNFNFNFDDLFKQFENDLFGDMSNDLKGHFSQHFSSHFSQHAQATGGAFSFDDLFNVSLSNCYVL